MPQNTPTITITETYPFTDDDVAALLGCASMGVSYWCVQWDHDKVKRTLTVRELDEPEKVSTTYDQIRQVFAELYSANKLPDWQMHELRNNDLGFDAEVGDMVIQQALFGEIVYG